MDVKTYCANMKEEVETWKSTVNQHMLKADRRSADVDEVLENIHKISDLVGQMEKNVADLEDQCPADWSSEKAQSTAFFRRSIACGRRLRTDPRMTCSK